jgi:hypothetical protein
VEIFRRTRDGGATARLEPGEAVLLRGLVGQVMDLIGSVRPPAGPADMDPANMGLAIGDPDREGDGTMIDLTDIFNHEISPEIPEDPALARLLPDAYQDDPDAAREFRRYTEASLVDAKRASAQTLLDTLPGEGGKVRLTGDQARAWLRAINDVRLAFGTRLEVTEDYEEQLAELNPEDPKAAAFEVYGWLGAVQSSLVQALL